MRLFFLPGTSREGASFSVFRPPICDVFEVTHNIYIYMGRPHIGYINAVIQAVKRSRGQSWEDVRTKLDPAVKASKGWLVPKL